MDTEDECLCCKEIPEVKFRMDEEEDDTGSQISCITEHSGFHPVCIDRHNLRTAYFAYRDRYGECDDPLNRRYRYTGYRQFVRWCWGHLGKDILVIIPSCAVLKIRDVYPADDGVYVGNKKVNLRI